MYYEIKLKVRKTDEKGEEKEVKEHFITNVELFSEAEAKGMELYASENMCCDVFAISRSNVIEIVNEKEEGKHFFKATVIDEQVDEKGIAKELKYYNLVSASDLREANLIMENHLMQGMSGIRLDAIVKTKIIDLI